MKTYTELILLPTFEERLNYLKLTGRVGQEVFGSSRYLNQDFYRSKIWKSIRDYVIIRDHGRDLALEGYEIFDTIYIHHINPITPESLIKHDMDDVLDPDNLVCVSFKTHNHIHYGADLKAPIGMAERKPGDQCPWR